MGASLNDAICRVFFGEGSLIVFFDGVYTMNMKNYGAFGSRPLLGLTTNASAHGSRLELLLFQQLTSSCIHHIYVAIKFAMGVFPSQKRSQCSALPSPRVCTRTNIHQESACGSIKSKSDFRKSSEHLRTMHACTCFCGQAHAVKHTVGLDRYHPRSLESSQRRT